MVIVLSLEIMSGIFSFSKHQILIFWSL